MIGEVRLACKHWLNDVRSQEQKLLIVATLLAALTMAMVSSFSDRLSRTMEYRATELIAGDVTLSSSRVIPNTYLEQATALGLRQSQALGFSTMAFANDQLQLVRVRAVDGAYPLKGSNHVGDHLDIAESVERTLKRGPEKGEVWAERQVLTRLGLNLGDEIELGDAVLQITKLLLQDADRSGSLFSPFGRILVSLDDVERMGVLGQGSRVFYKHYFTGDQSAIKQFVDWVEPKLEKGERLAGIETGQNNVGGALEKAQKYLSLASLISVLLAAVAIALCAQSYSERHQDTVALFRCLGASGREVTRLFITKILITAVIASILGAAAGFVLHYALLESVREWLPSDLMGPSAWPVVLSAISSASVLLLIALSPILSLRQISPVRVLRRSRERANIKVNTLFVLALGIMSSLAYLLTNSLLMALIFVGGLAVLLLLYGVLSSAMLAFFTRIRGALPSFFQVGLVQLSRHQFYARSQVAAFAFIFTAVSLIWLVRSDLFENWQRQIPEDTPNYFAINILPEKRLTFEKALQEKGLSYSDFYPMVRGRLMTINGQSVNELFSQEDMPGAINRELNLSWSGELREDQTLESGEWFDDSEQALNSDVSRISLESGLAERLGVGVGDQFTFNIAGTELKAVIASTRKVEWENFQPNFYVIFEPGTIETFHHTFISSFYLPTEDTRWLVKLNREFKAVTVIEIERILKQVRDIVAQTSIAVEAIMVLVLLCAMVLMFATLLSTLGLRKQEAALFRTFGASERWIRYRVRCEYLTLSMVASVLTIVSFESISAGLYVFLFDVSWQPHFTLWIAVPVLASASMLFSGALANRSVVRASPIELLKEMA